LLFLKNLSEQCNAILQKGKGKIGKKKEKKGKAKCIKMENKMKLKNHLLRRQSPSQKEKWKN